MMATSRPSDDVARAAADTTRPGSINKITTLRADVLGKTMLQEDTLRRVSELADELQVRIFETMFQGAQSLVVHWDARCLDFLCALSDTLKLTRDKKLCWMICEAFWNTVDLSIKVETGRDRDYVDWLPEDFFFLRGIGAQLSSLTIIIPSGRLSHRFKYFFFAALKIFNGFPTPRRVSVGVRVKSGNLAARSMSNRGVSGRLSIMVDHLRTAVVFSELKFKGLAIEVWVEKDGDTRKSATMPVEGDIDDAIAALMGLDNEADAVEEDWASSSLYL